MEKMMIAVAAVAVGLALVACAPAATDAELDGMCTHLVDLRGEVDTSSAEEAIAAVEKEFVVEEKRLRDWMARDLKSWDDELAAKLEELEGDDEKKKLTEEYEGKKEVTRKQHLPGIEALGPKKKAAVEEAKKKVAANEKKHADAVAECVESAKKEGVNQKLAQCRIAAPDKDTYWNKCR
jgi:hypothetical protein